MDYSMLFNECYKRGVMYNPAKCRLDISLFWTGISFVLLLILLSLIIACFNICRLLRN
uniref:p7 protein n=1 Tax=Sweet potato chlorotic stunt virus TaxID=81931 RepID=M0QTD4_9CLOS|nr:p7 protein [Sweet potato chlorotic stunt virus]